MSRSLSALPCSWRRHIALWPPLYPAAPAAQPRASARAAVDDAGVVHRRRRVGALALELADIGASGEGLAFAAQHDAAQSLVGREREQRVAEHLPRPARQRVEAPGIAEHDRGDGAV